MESGGEHGWGMGTMELLVPWIPMGDGDVMVGYEVCVTRVRFTSLPVRGMLLEGARGRRMAGQKGDWGRGGAKLVLGDTFVPEAFISFDLFIILHI